MKEYQDEFMQNNVQNIIELQKEGKFVISGFKAEYGLPTRDMVIGQTSRLTVYGSGHDYVIGNSGFLDYDHRSGQYIFTPNPGSELPEVLRDYQQLHLHEAIIDQAGRIAKIDTGEETIILRHAPVWCYPYELLDQINKELVRTNTGCVVWKLRWENEDPGDHLFEAGIPKLRNGQTMVHLSGYAIDQQARSLIYAGCFGYKTSIESIRASLQSSNFLTIGFDLGSDLHLSANGKYRYLWQNLPEHSSHHACFIQQNAIPNQWVSEDLIAYVLVFQDQPDPDSALMSGLIDRLGEVLELPVLADWKEKIWERAQEAELIEKLDTAGDCTAGIRVDLQGDWQNLFESMLADREILVH